MNQTYKFNKRVVTLPADTHTPVGVYLKFRDAYPGAILLECTDYNSQQNAFSHICLSPILGIQVDEKSVSSYYLTQEKIIEPIKDIIVQVDTFINRIKVNDSPNKSFGVEGLFGFAAFDSALLFDRYAANLTNKISTNRNVPFLRYDFFKLVISFNHFNDTLSITEFYNTDTPISSIEDLVVELNNRNFGSYPFATIGEEFQVLSDSDFKTMISKSKEHCQRGDVFQLVVSKPFQQQFSGDEFNVYRSLRSVNPSPYLFYFDYIDYKIFGSSPEAQLKIANGKASINPIAGTVKRSGNEKGDQMLIEELLANPKENSEHVMLVDLARNDLSKNCDNVIVETYKEVQIFSHVIHLVSTVTGDLHNNISPFALFAKTFPAGTLSGAPKHRAIELIVGLEPQSRGFYGGAIGYIGLDGTLNHAITIRSFFSSNGFLTYQAGAGVVINSSEEGELQEVNNKLNALRVAMQKASNYINI